MAELEHVNITVSNAKDFASKLERIFGWTVRWSGDIESGNGAHVGSENHYVALFQMVAPLPAAPPRYSHSGTLNHLGVRVDDLEAVEERVKALGYAPHHHADYEPGRRFYFMMEDSVEVEVVSYT